MVARISSLFDCEVMIESPNVAGSADSTTLWGSSLSTNHACDYVCALATEMGVGTRYIHPDKDGDKEKGCETANNVKICCASARNVPDRSTAYCD